MRRTLQLAALNLEVIRLGGPSRVTYPPDTYTELGTTIFSTCRICIHRGIVGMMHRQHHIRDTCAMRNMLLRPSTPSCKNSHIPWFHSCRTKSVPVWSAKIQIRVWYLWHLGPTLLSLVHITSRIQRASIAFFLPAVNCEDEAAQWHAVLTSSCTPPLR